MILPVHIANKIWEEMRDLKSWSVWFLKCNRVAGIGTVLVGTSSKYYQMSYQLGAIRSL